MTFIERIMKSTGKIANPEHTVVMSHNTQAAVKVADQIIARLFDHRQFTSGEIRYLIKEFEGQCSLDDTLDRALKQQEDVVIISDMTENNICKLDDNQAIDLNQQVLCLLDRADSLLEIENEREQQRNRALESSRAERKNVMESSSGETLAMIEEIDKVFGKKEKELEERYLKLEEKIKDSN